MPLELSFHWNYCCDWNLDAIGTKLSLMDIWGLLRAHYESITSPFRAHYESITSPLPTHYEPITSPLRAHYKPIPSPLILLKPLGYFRIHVTYDSYEVLKRFEIIWKDLKVWKDSKVWKDGKFFRKCSTTKNITTL